MAYARACGDESYDENDEASRSEGSNAAGETSEEDLDESADEELVEDEEEELAETPEDTVPDEASRDSGQVDYEETVSYQCGQNERQP